MCTTEICFLWRVKNEEANFVEMCGFVFANLLLLWRELLLIILYKRLISEGAAPLASISVAHEVCSQ